MLTYFRNITQKWSISFFTGSILCPVKTFELHLSRLDPNCTKLWQKPKKFVDWNDKIWYEGGYKNQGIGKNPLGEFMPTLSENAKLSRHYTNHSIRGTCITILDQKGFEARDIMTVSSHKREETIKSYSCTSDTRKRQMSHALSNALENTKKPKLEEVDNVVKPSTGTVECSNTNSNNNNNVDSQESSVEMNETPTIRELLELTADQEKEFFQAIFSEDFPHPDSIVPKQTSVNINTSNIQNKPTTTASVLPKMLFNNSNITINFNIQK